MGPRQYRREFKVGEISSIDEGFVGRTFIEAMNKAKESFDPVQKDGINQHDRYRYPTESSLKAAVEEPLRANGFEIVHAPISLPGWAGATTTIMHTSGEYRSVSFVLPVVARAKKDEPAPQIGPKDHGAAISYAKRYGLMGLLGISAADDETEGTGAIAHGAAKPAPAANPAPSAGREIRNGGRENGGRLVKVIGTSTKEGQTNGRTWTRYGIRLQDQTTNEEFWATTFDQDLFERVVAAGGGAVSIEERENNGQRFYNLTGLLALPAQPPAGSGESVENGSPEGGEQDDDIPF